MEPVEITEAGLLLRGWRAADADAVHRACQDADIQRWTRVPSPYRHADAVGFVTGSTAAWADGTGAPLAVCDAGTGELLGSCGLVSIDPDLASAEVGYWVAPWARGRGVAVRALRAVARWALHTLGVRRLTWHAGLDNHASRLVALRAGFQVDGELRQPDGGRAWIGSLLPGEVPAADAPADGGGGPAGPGTLVARRAAVFGRPQPVLFATTAAGTEISLRPAEERDVDDIVTACRDEQSIAWTTLPVPYQRADAESFVHDFMPTAWARGAAAEYAVAGPDDRWAGSVSLRLSAVDPGLADVGFMTAPYARGRGFMPAALTALTTRGFTTLVAADLTG
jgi:RimJ/RimL family protein N-acetyltransferase